MDLAESVLLQDQVSVCESAEGDDSFQGFSYFSAWAICINMIVGAGILGLPYAFFQAGAVFSTACLVFATILSAITVGYLIETLGWCEGYLSAPEEGEGDRLIQTQGPVQGRNGPQDSKLPVDLSVDENGSMKIDVSRDRECHDGSEMFVIRRRKFEMTEMVGIFLGIRVSEDSFLARFADAQGLIHPVRTFLEIALCLYTFASCWLYSSVFASTLSSLIPIEENAPEYSKCWSHCAGRTLEACGSGCVVLDGQCHKDESMVPYCWGSYRLFLGVFVVFQLVLCTINLNTFKNLQVIMSMMAFCSIVVMVITSLVASKVDDGAIQGYNQVAPFRFSGLMAIITSGLFAQGCHQGVPTVVVMMKDKRQAKSVFAAALAYTLTVYVVLSFSTSFYFGPRTNPTITLNWASFTGFAQPGEPVPGWARVVSFIVMMFPVITVTAAFSLQIIPLAESVYWMLPDVKSQMKPSTVRMLLRIGWSLAPIFCAAFERNIQAILDCIGLLAFFLEFFIPCALQLEAKRRCIRRFGPQGGKTPYWNWSSHPAVVWTIVGLSLVLMVLVGAQIYEARIAEA